MQKLTKKIINLKLQIPLIIAGVLITPIVALAVVQSLNGQSGQTQSFSNDTNVSMSSANNVHSLNWNGILSVGRGGTGASSFSGGSVLFSNGTSIAQNNSNLFWDDTNNRLGIGTTQPTSPLHVIGNALVTGNLDVTGNITGNITSTNLVPYTGAIGNVDLGTHNLTATSLISTTDSIIHSLTVGLGGGSVGSNTTVGLDALKYNTTGYNNTAVGYAALMNQGGGGESTAVGYQALMSNTSGSDQNTAVGVFALRENTTGSYNNAFGPYALRNNTTGIANTALGLGSLQNNNGNENTAVGHYSLLENTTGNYNIAIGREAGRKQANNSNLTTPERSIYIGLDSRGLDNNDYNSIVIGSTAIGAGANTAVIGNSSVSDVYFGSSSGNAKLHASNISTVSSGTSAPSSTPTALGQIYVDTTTAKVYISTGISSSADWTIIN